jgi:hypothetical protein
MFVRWFVGSFIRSSVDVHDMTASFNLPHSSVYELEEKVLLGEAQQSECATSFACLYLKITIIEQYEERKNSIVIDISRNR